MVFNLELDFSLYLPKIAFLGFIEKGKGNGTKLVIADYFFQMIDKVEA